MFAWDPQEPASYPEQVYNRTKNKRNNKNSTANTPAHQTNVFTKSLNLPADKYHKITSQNHSQLSPIDKPNLKTILA